MMVAMGLKADEVEVVSQGSAPSGESHGEGAPQGDVRHRHRREGGPPFSHWVRPHFTGGCIRPFRPPPFNWSGGRT